MSVVKKGTVTTIEGNKARVMSAIKEGDITRPLVLAKGIDAEELKKGSEVAYVVFEDMTGVILAKMKEE